ncbi:hypothetical protein [Macrococcus equipercicus]|uniref:Uncharacterized protein n=1 Tax=Macrococcus equipercicus TaxID=69967 RepID=A0A9Q9BVA3_9STAP|nr:hypothetical protein [Macrococcus equipercicus]KAA1039474.1 hypothetical protein ERX35_005185 [Macrococcus equipercicus]UTH13772.1 hypothetical protein KFV11_11300 [Macrococcus equipercicus]
MSTTYKKLFVFVLGLIEIIAGFAVYKTSLFGAFVFIALGLLFLIVMFIIDRRANNPYNGRFIN